MGFRWGRSAQTLATIAVLASARAAAADELRLEYTAPAGCPSKETFLAGVVARTPRASESDPTRTFVVELTQGDGESSGRLVVRGEGGAETERQVAGDTCEEVVSALALMTALTIDPNASTSPVPPAPEPPPPVAPSPPIAPSPGADAPPAAPTRSDRWSVAMSVEASVVSGIAPRMVVGVPLAIHVASPDRGFFSPSLHLAAERASSGSIDVAGASAAFRWTVGVLEACPGRLQTDALRVEPCVRFEAGALEGVGSDIVPAREDTRAWVALGAVGRAEWTIARPLFLELEGGLRLPVTRTTYYFEPDSTIYRAPAVAGIVGAGVGARFL